MISDNDLYTLAIFLGSLSMLLIVLYHFLEVNSSPDERSDEKIAASRSAAGVAAAGGKGGSPTLR